MFTQGLLACVLCGKDMETHTHLFFQRSYSLMLWQYMQGRIGESCPATNWQGIINWAAAKWKGKKPQQMIPRMAMQALVYSIWRKRNARSFQNRSRSREEVNKEVNFIIHAQILVK